MKEDSTMSRRRDIDNDVMMETEEVVSKSKLAAPVSDDHVDEVEGRDDWNSSGNNRGDVNDGAGREDSSKKTTKPSPSRKPRNSSTGGSSQSRRYQQDAYQGQYQGRPGPYPHPTHHGGPRNHPNGPPYPQPPYGYAPGPAGAPHDPYRGGPPPPPPHFHQAPPLPHPGQYTGPHGAPYHPGSAYHPMSGPNYRVPQYPPISHPYAGSHYHNGPPQGVYPAASDSSSIASSKSKTSVDRKSSKASKGPSKKRTINGVHSESRNPDLAVYPFRRTGSNASTSSTVTAGNNTSTETPNLTEDSPQRTRNRGSELPPLSSANLFEDADQLNQMNHHRRNHSTASTASSLSVGGFSLSSYDRPRGGGDGTTHEDSAMIKASPKKRKSNGSSLSAIDTGSLHNRAASNSSNSIDVAGAPSRFQKLSMEDASSKPPSGAAASHKRENSARNLFLTMSTSPINCDVEATPNIKNTKKSGNPSDSSNGTNSFDRGGDTPTPTEAMAERDMMTNEHMLNQHLRSQSFTPLSHLANGSENGRESISNSPTMNNQSFPGIAPQLSWSIAGDAPSLADLTDWEEEIQNTKSSEHKRDNSFLSKASSGIKGMSVSPHEFGMWKEEEEGAGETATPRDGVLSPSSDMNEESANTESTPLPVFFGHPVSSEERENVMKTHPRYMTSNETEKSEEYYRNQSSRMNYQDSSSTRQVQPQFGDAEHIHQLFLSNGGRGSTSKGNQPFRMSSWSSEYGRKSVDTHHMRLPPTPVYSEHRDEAFGRSPLNSDGRDGPPNFFASNMFGPGSGMRGHNDRVRNLRGRVPSGHHAPMQLQIPQQTVSHHHNLTSPMGIGASGKSGMWGHPGGIHPPVPSPHHMPPVDMNSSKRKCMPLKPPIPSKYQGDIEKMKTAKVPEFANLVNFPNHMSQKQSVNLPEGMRCCVMCGQACPCSTGNKNKKNAEKKAASGGKSDGGLAPRNSNGQDAKEKQNSGYAIIPTQNKGLCTLCDVNVWVVTQSGLEIKWCKGCKNFRPWAAFGDKGLATKCLRCRERQREKYALQKEEKERARLVSKGMAKTMANSKA